ncbi:MAG: glycosyl transferase [Aeromicrobium sp.]|nr:glycosyl transferase [Aeromicrobium sp.]
MASDGPNRAARPRLRTRLQRWLISRIRRSRFLPATTVDRVADVDRLNIALTQSGLVYFATSQATLYQIRPWLPALRRLDAEVPLAVVFRDSRAAAIVRAESGLDCFTVGTQADLDGIVTRSDVKLALYINLDPLDFDCLRFGSMMHAYIGHGDSAKAVFASNQVKAFDRYFIAGDAAAARLERELMEFDPATRCVKIGQPQLDGFEPSPPTEGARPVVVYAPTWEGAQNSQSSSSLLTHGPAIVDALVQDGRFDIVYRPHPLTGSEDPRLGEVDAAIRRTLAGSGHRVDASPTLATAFDGASVLITDVSAAASFWLVTGRPMIVTSGGVAEPMFGSRIPSLGSGDAPRTAEIVASLLADPPNLLGVVAEHLGDTTPGAATSAFVAACITTIEQRDRLLHSGS